MDEAALKTLLVDVKREALKRGHRLMLSTRGTSMFPLIQSKDRVALVGFDLEKLKSGDIIVYQAASSDIIAHRLIRKANNIQGRVFIAKGDICLYCDSPVIAGRVLGKITRIKKAYFTLSLDNLGGCGRRAADYSHQSRSNTGNHRR